LRWVFYGRLARLSVMIDVYGLQYIHVPSFFFLLLLACALHTTDGSAIVYTIRDSSSTAQCSCIYWFSSSSLVLSFLCVKSASLLTKERFEARRHKTKRHSDWLDKRQGGAAGFDDFDEVVEREFEAVHR
jgi:hypothetical protein